jgi:RNA polymerase sigma-70 factor (sigma-E family)
VQSGTAAASGGRRGDDEGRGDFSSFVAARWSALVRTAYLLTGDFHEAEDLVQVTLAKVYPHWGALHEETADAYVRRALVNNNRSRHRRRRVAQLLMAFVPDRPAAGAGPGDVAERALLVSLLAELPERQRAVVVLRYWEDLPVEEVAELLGCSVRTVKSQASRALVKLRNHPGLEEFALTALGADR